MQTSLQYTLKAAARGALALACLTLCLAQPAPCAGPKQKAPKVAPSQAVPVPGQAFDVYRGQPDMTEDEIVRYEGPLLIIQGDEDEAVPLSYAKKAAELYKNAKLIIIKGDDHCYTRHLQEVVAAVKEFFA